MSRIDEIQGRTDAATEGPWGAYAGCIRQNRSWREPSEVVVDYDGERPNINNALFIAHARDDVPFLLAMVRELQGRVDAGLAALDDPRVGKTAKALLRAAITATEES